MCAALAGMLVLFENHDSCAVTQHKTIAILVPGSTGALWVVITGRERPSGTEAAKPNRRRCHLSTTSQHDICLAQRDQLRCQADIMSSGRTCCRHGQTWATQVVAYGECPAQHIGNSA